VRGRWREQAKIFEKSPFLQKPLIGKRNIPEGKRKENQRGSGERKAAGPIGEEVG